MNRIFAVITEEDREVVDFKFITITDNDMKDPKNLGASAESIMKAKHMDYENVEEYWDSWVDFNDGMVDGDASLEEIEKALDDEYSGYASYPGYNNNIDRYFKEYKN